MGSNVNSDIFKILIATDNHLGFNEKDPERGNDSYTTFEEILELAIEKQVDFVLLGGDLFHDNKPSRNSFLKCMELLKKYSYGEKPVNFDFVSDPTENFPHLKNPVVNYQDPNLNIGIPVFSIHGNHDDPSGLGQHSPLDMLSAAGLINYFGRASDLNDIKISPILLTKGKTKLALYGLSSIKDERLFRLFNENKVKMLRPKEDFDDWFNVLVLHQNHTKHSMSNYIPEQFLDNFLHLVLWGHEHECLIEPRQTDEGSFFVSQPGSSVATSLCAGEAVEKKIALLEIDPEKHMRITPIKLNTVRPFVFEDLYLEDCDIPIPLRNVNDNPVERFVEEHVCQMVEKAKLQITGHKDQPKKPLLRLRVHYSDESQMFNVSRFGYKFLETVANANDIILFKKVKKDVKKPEGLDVDQEAMESIFEREIKDEKVEQLVTKYFKELDQDSPNQLQLLSEIGLGHAVEIFVEKDEKDAIKNIFEKNIEKASKYLLSVEHLDEDNILDEINNYRLMRLTKEGRKEEEDDLAAFQNLLSSKKKSESSDCSSGSDLNDAEDDTTPSHSTSTNTRGVRGGRARATRSRGRGRSNQTQLQMVSDESAPVPPSRASSSRGRARGSKTSNAKIQSSMDSFIRPSSSRSQRKGAMFDAD